MSNIEAEAGGKDAAGAKRDWLVKVLKIELGGAGTKASVPDPQEAVFNRQLREAIPAIEIARGLPADTEAAKAAHDEMEDRLADALDAAKAGEFTEAIDFLAKAIAATAIISDERIRSEAAKERLRGEQEAAFNRQLGEAVPVIEIARGLPAESDKAKAAHGEMEDRMADALEAAKAGDFAEAIDFLAKAVAATDIISDERVRGEQEAEFNRQLREAMSAIEVARGLTAASDKAAVAHETMENSFADAVDAAKQGSFPEAGEHLAKSVDAAQIVSDEREAARDAFLKRHETLEAAFGKIGERAGKLVAPAAAIAGALKAVEDAKAAAEEAGAAEDWPESIRALDAFERVTGELNIALAAEAATQAAGFAARFDPHKAAKPIGAAQIKLRSAYLVEQKKLAGLVATDPLGALEACPAVEKALASFEASAVVSPTDKTRIVTETTASVAAISDSDLAAKSMTEKAELAFNLCAAGQPSSGPELVQLCRVYRATPPDPGFVAARDEQKTKIAAAVAKIANVSNLFDASGRVDRAAWRRIIADPNKVRDLLKQVQAEQLKVLGLPDIPLTTYSKPAENGNVSMGGYSPSTRAIRLNAHADAVSKVREALISIIHETFHAQQHVLIDKLMSGELGPDDPLYPQVLMFAANWSGSGYLPPQVNQADYEAQPIEIDAEEQGTKAVNVLMIEIMKVKAASRV
jgi:hypothetical protein